MSITFNDTETMRNTSPLLASDNVRKTGRRVSGADPKTILSLRQRRK